MMVMVVVMMAVMVIVMVVVMGILGRIVYDLGLRRIIDCRRRIIDCRRRRRRSVMMMVVMVMRVNCMAQCVLTKREEKTILDY